MTPPSPSLPALHAPVGCAAALVPWQTAAGRRLTIVVKIAFPLGEGELTQLAPAPVMQAREVHVQRSPLRSLEAIGDLAPALPRAEVVLFGSARATGGVAAPAVTTQLQVARADVVLRKRAHAVGDRARHGEPPQPFRSMPIDWERSVKTELNPIGVSPTSRGANWIDPADPARAIGFGAIPSTWPRRREKRGKVSASALEGELAEIPADFDWTYFQAAPEDQQLAGLVGDEWIALDGFHPTLPRQSFRLPQRRLAARFVHPSGRVLQERDLAPDRLVLDVDGQLGTLTHRAVLAADWASLEGFRIEIGIGRLGAEVTFADAGDPSTHRALPARSGPAADIPLDRTVSVDTARAASPATPFRAAPPDIPAPPPSGRHWTFVDEGTTGSIVVGPPPGAPTMPFGRPGEGGPPAPAATLPFAKPAPGAPAPVPPAPVPPAPGAPAPVPPAPAPPAPVAPAPVAPAPGGPPPPPFAGPPPAPPGVDFDDDDDGGGRTRAVDVSAVLRVATPFAGDGPAPAAAQSSSLEGLPFASASAAPPPEAISAVGAGAAGAAAPPVAPAEALLRGDHIPTRVDGRLLLFTTVWEPHPPQSQLVVIAKASFDLAHGQTSPLSEETDLAMGDVFVDDDLDGPLVFASDFAPVKPKVDVLLSGHAYAPGGRATAMQVAIRLRGPKVRFDRELAVFGDRTWQRAVVAVAPSAPAPFEKLPLTWTRAFGGPGVRDNPVGVGHRGAAGKDGVARLPNLELPNRLIKAPDDAPPPASLGPVSPLWPARWSLLGTYDVAWFKTRWPHYAADLDPAYFQSAPPAQRLDALEGGEEYELVGVHPERGAIRGALPGVRARAFVQKTQAAGGAFVEVPMRLDTLTFHPDRDKGHLVWRGRLDVSDDDAPEIDEIFAFLEPLGGPALSLEEARLRHEEARKDPEEEERPPPPPEPPPPEDPDAEADAAAEKAVLDRIAAIEKEAPPAPEEPPPLPPFDPGAFAAMLRESGAEPAEVDALVGAMTGKTETEPPPGPPIDLRAFVKERVAAGEPLSELDLRGADLSDLDLSGQSLAKSDLSSASLERALLTGADLSGARLIGASLAAAKLSGAKLDGADLTRADFTGADLTGASLVEAEGEGTRFVDATLVGAILDEATLPKGDWTRANAEGLSAANLILTESRLDGARLARANTPAIRLYGVRARQAVLDGADLTNARCNGAVLTSCSLKDVTASESVWERADLTTSTLQGATLLAAGFTRVVARKTNFNECDLSGSRFRKAVVDGATFVRANLMGADLEKASFELADLRGANLHEAFVHRTNLKHAKTEHAIVTYSALGRKQP